MTQAHRHIETAFSAKRKGNGVKWHPLKGPKLVAKINRSIDKRRDRLELDFGELLDSPWWPLASLPDVGS